jgi:hypothetical protein
MRLAYSQTESNLIGQIKGEINDLYVVFSNFGRLNDAQRHSAIIAFLKLDKKIDEYKEADIITPATLGESLSQFSMIGRTVMHLMKTLYKRNDFTLSFVPEQVTTKKQAIDFIEKHINKFEELKEQSVLPNAKMDRKKLAKYYATFFTYITKFFNEGLVDIQDIENFHIILKIQKYVNNILGGHIIDVSLLNPKIRVKLSDEEKDSFLISLIKRFVYSSNPREKMLALSRLKTLVKDVA